MSVDRPAKDRASAPSGERRNSLRMSPRELASFLDDLDAPDGKDTQGNRKFHRLPFRQDGVQVLVAPAGGGASKVSMACRNISRTGLSLLHNCYMHPGTKCTVLLPHPTRGQVPVPGAVARCVHRSGMAHEIGIRFNEPIEVREFAHPDAFGDCFSLERVQPEELAGNVVYVDHSEMDVRIVKHFLRGTAVTLRTAATIADAMVLIEGRPDVVITDFELPDGTGASLIAAVRERGIEVPFILVTGDTGDSTRRAISASRPDACLAKPLTQALLQRALGEYLIVRAKSSQAQAPPGPDAETAALVRTFIDSLTQTVAEVEAAIKGSNADQARSLCLQIAGPAPTVGFAHLGELAQLAARALSTTKSIPDSLKPIQAMMTACERTRARPAA